MYSCRSSIPQKIAHKLTKTLSLFKMKCSVTRKENKLNFFCLFSWFLLRRSFPLMSSFSFTVFRLLSLVAVSKSFLNVCNKNDASKKYRASERIKKREAKIKWKHREKVANRNLLLYKNGCVYVYLSFCLSDSVGLFFAFYLTNNLVFCIYIS